MKVKMIAHTPQELCSVASRICVSKECPEDTLYEKSLMSAMRQGHDSVLEHSVYTFIVSGISRVTSHQLVRHRIASYAQQSQRYVYDNCRTLSDIVIPDSMKNETLILEKVEELISLCKQCDAPSEDIRYLLPQGCVTNILVTMNARELKQFFHLRCCSHAQWEIRELANRMLEQCKEASPLIFSQSTCSGCKKTCENYIKPLTVDGAR